MRLAILWLSSGCLLLVTLVGTQQIGQDLLISRMGSWQDELKTRNLARATSYLTRNYIANRINTLVVRQSCLECPHEMSHRQRQLVDQILESLSPDLSVLLPRETPQETSWEYTLFVVVAGGRREAERTKACLNIKRTIRYALKYASSRLSSISFVCLLGIVSLHFSRLQTHT